MTEGTTAPRPQVRLVTAAVLLVTLAQMTLNPIIPPLARELGLAEWQIGVMVSTAALCIVLSSQRWGRLSQSWGRKPVLVTAMATASAAMALFALLAQLGMDGLLRGTGLFLLLVLLRGVLFGLGMAAVAPTAQAYIADVTTTERERVAGMAGIGAAQGIAMIGGSIVGGTLAALGLIVPLIAVPVLLAGSTALMALRLRREGRHELVEVARTVRPTDARVWPFLLVGFGLFTALGFVQIIIGFIVQDRYGLDAPTTALATGGSLLAAGLGMVVAQAVIVPRSGWAPVRLLRVGAAIALLGFLGMLLPTGLPVLIGAVLLIGLGLGIAMPGYTAGPSLAVAPDEQGGLAGLLGATNALTFVIAPTAGTALYGWLPIAPALVSTAVIVLVLLLLWLHPRFRRGAATEVPATEAQPST